MTPQRGYFVLHTNVLPPVTAGAYELRSEQTGLPFTVAPETTHVTVASPRYSMPTDQILSTFPPANAEGAFGDRLPQLVLKRRTLPWERNPAGGTAVSATPWLALVVIAEGEGELSTATPVTQCVTPGRTLPDAADKDVEQALYLAVTETVVHRVFPCQQDLPLLCHVREVDVTDTELANGDDDGWLAVVLANRLPVYDTAADKPVRYLACLINLEGQLGELPPPVPSVDHFEFELVQDWSVLAQLPTGPDPIVMGNVDLAGIVLPAAGVQHLAAPQAQVNTRATRTDVVGVAGLDGMRSTGTPSTARDWAARADAARANTAAVTAAASDPDAAYIVRDTMGRGFRYPISAFAIERVLRFPVLAHWSFTTSGSETFEVLMQQLDVGLLGTVDEPKPDDPPPATAPPEVVQTGHLGLGHRTRRGDSVRCWYRGPFVPFPTERDAPVDGRLPVSHAADQLRRVVPGGREDLSLAAAFEIGRLLGLSQLSIVGALTRFRSDRFGAGRVRTVLGSIADLELPKYVDNLDRLALGRFVALSVLTDLSTTSAKTLGPRRPLVDPGRELKVGTDLDAMIANGLGLDLSSVVKRADSIGIVAALTQTAVPTAARPGASEVDLAGLRGGLTAELGHVLSVAVPARAVVPPVRLRGAARAAAPEPEPDALDRLLGGDD